MRFYSGHHAFTCGVDRRGRTLVLCVLDRAGQVVFRRHRNRPCKKEAVLGALAPFRVDLLGGCERIFCCRPSDLPTLPLTRACDQRIHRDRRIAEDGTRVPMSFPDVARRARDRTARIRAPETR